MPTIPSLRIFLVDDEPFCLGLYQQYLSNLGQKDVRAFSSSAACLDQLTSQPDLIFLDYNMDSINGLDMLKKIKRFDPNALVAFISGQEEIGVAVNTLQYGALDYLTKNHVSEESLGKILEKAMQLKQLTADAGKRSWLQKILPAFVCTLFLFQLSACTTHNLFQTKQNHQQPDTCFTSVKAD